MAGADGPDAVFAALADPTRRQLLALLGQRGEATATDLARELPVTPPGGPEAPRAARDRRAGGDPPLRARGPLPPHPAPMSDAMAWMAEVGSQWDARLAALERQLARAGRPAPSR